MEFSTLKSDNQHGDEKGRERKANRFDFFQNYFDRFAVNFVKFIKSWLKSNMFYFQFEDEQVLMKRSNAELINGLIGMDLNRLSAMGKRSNAELINGLLGMNLNKLSSAGKR